LCQRFDFIPSSAFLTALLHAPESTENGLKLSPQDVEMFQKLQSKVTAIGLALKEFKKRSRDDVAMDEDE
jgi:hypothetical protein